ncbi:hypothetical protein [Corallococcus sp. EGB]|uniref:hypothetical protein n=1 Tax=Corallococcus sp. EGB TaxID=1521117 RepID=UPI001CBB4AA0|nr:hypothetical protein [Corallococcus sp. EGB]
MNADVAGSAVRSAFNTSQGLNETESATLKGLKGDDLVRARAQLMLQKQQEAAAFASNIMKKLSDIAMSIIGNTK